MTSNNRYIMSTPLMYSIHNKDENPVYGESNTRITLDDTSGGAFFVLSQDDVNIEMELDELVQLLITAKQMAETYRLATCLKS